MTLNIGRHQAMTARDRLRQWTAHRRPVYLQAGQGLPAPPHMHERSRHLAYQLRSDNGSLTTKTASVLVTCNGFRSVTAVPCRSGA